VFLPAVNACHKVHGKKGKDADLKGLKCPCIRHENGCGGKDQQKKQTHAYD
jgi:hypothetical protein